MTAGPSLFIVQTPHYSILLSDNKTQEGPWGAEGRLEEGSVNICPLGPRSSERLKQTEYALCDEERTLWRSHPVAPGSPSVRTKQTVFRIYGAVKQREIEEERRAPVPSPSPSKFQCRKLHRWQLTWQLSDRKEGFINIDRSISRLPLQ